jgi:RNA polymerase sigma factor (sigma-70 family)
LPEDSNRSATLLAARQGDHRACERLLEPHRSWLLGYFRHRTLSEDAEDLTQKTLIAASLQLETFRGDAPLSAWLLGIANRLLFRHWERDPIGSGRLRLDPLGEEVVPREQQPDLSTALIRTMEKFWLSERLLERMKRCCSEEEQRVLVLYYQGETLSEIATLLQTPDATVRSHLLRARGKILAELVEKDPEVLGGRAAIEAAWQKAQHSDDPPGEKEQAAWNNPQRHKALFRAACLKMARFLPIPALVLILALPSVKGTTGGRPAVLAQERTILREVDALAVNLESSRHTAFSGVHRGATSRKDRNRP